MKYLLLCKMAAVAFLLAALSACSSAPSVPTNAGKQPAPQAAPDNSAAPQTEWDRVMTEAKREDRVVIYAAYGVAQAREPFVRTFKDRFGISLEMTVARGPELTAKLVNERRAGLYMADVYIGGSTSIANELVPKGMLDPLEPYFILPEVKNPALWFGGTLPIWDTQRTALASFANITSRMAINNSLLQPQEFTSYRDLLKPKLKGLIIMTDPTTAGGGLSWYSMASKLMGVDYIKDLIRQDLILTRDFRLMNEWLIRGKYQVGVAVDSGGVRALIKDGAPLYMLPPFKEGVDLGMGGGNIAVVNNNPHPNSTRVFTNWVLSKEGQTVFSRAIGMASRRVDVPTDHLDPWMVPDPKFTYIMETEQDIKDEYTKIQLSREIFASLLK